MSIICTSCQETSPAGSKFCIGCRHPLPIGTKSVCGQGHRLDPTWTECPFCKANAPSGDPAPAPQPKPTQQRAMRQTMVEVTGPPTGQAGTRTPNPAAVPQPSAHTPQPNAAPPSRQTQVITKQAQPSRGPIVAALLARRANHQAIFPLFTGHNIIGSDPKASVCLKQDSAVSRKHAVLFVTDTDIILDDCLSTNGTQVNGESIKVKVSLKETDTFHVGVTAFQIRRFKAFV